VSGLLAWSSIRTTTTGVPSLGYSRDRPLEVGIWVTDAGTPWKFRGAVNHVVKPWPGIDEVMDRCTPEALEWHRASGLFQLMSMNVTQDLTDLEEEVIDLLQRYGDPGEFVLAGRGCGIIERPLLEEWMPSVYEWMNKDLVLDISGISYVMGLSGLSEELEPHFEPTGQRAMHDAQRYSLEFEHYTKVFKQVPLTEPAAGRQREAGEEAGE
jgi:oligoribonuclease (3'-5' exoribonuclease)